MTSADATMRPICSPTSKFAASAEDIAFFEEFREKVRPRRPSELSPVEPEGITICDKAVRVLKASSGWMWLSAADFAEAIQHPAGRDEALLEEALVGTRPDRVDRYVFAGSETDEPALVILPIAAFDLATAIGRGDNKLRFAINRGIDRIADPDRWPTAPLQLRPDGTRPPRPDKYSGYLAQWKELKFHPDYRRG